jgi:RHS repeat-associated protein
VLSSSSRYYLGSNSVMSYGQGHASDLVGKEFSGSRGRYLSFGGWRVTPMAATSTGSAQALTDVGFTGHRHNNIGANDLGLVYMGARFYLPGVGRFLSADTLVPDPKNSQSWNRYGYVENRPLNFTDPTGHWLESAWDAFNVGLGAHSLIANPFISPSAVEPVSTAD